MKDVVYAIESAIERNIKKSPEIADNNSKKSQKKITVEKIKDEEIKDDKIKGDKIKNKEKKKKKKKNAEMAIDFSDEIKRMKRICGQIEGIQSMLKAGRKLEEIIIQCKAVHSAISSVERRIFKAHLDKVLSKPKKLKKKKYRKNFIENIEALFKLN